MTDPLSISAVCPKCGGLSEAGARFCPHCGSSLPSRPVRPEALLGLTVDKRYRLEERAGADALTRIYRGVDTQTNSPVLIRVVHDHFAGIATFAEEFVQRLQAVCPLSHSGVLRTLAAGRSEVGGHGFLYVVNEPFEGRNLCAIVHGRGLLPPAQVMIIGIQVLDCLAAVHKQGALHSDLRPESIVIGATADGVVRPKVADFGLGSLAAESLARLTLGGSSLGTPLYSSPERLRKGEVDARSDLYSMGAILYEQLTGTAVFEANSALVIEHRHLDEAPEPLHARAPLRGIDPALEDVILKALRKDPKDRFQTAQEMGAALVIARGKEASAESASLPPGSRRDSRLLPSTLHMSVSGMSRRSHALGREELIESVRAVSLAPVEESNHGSVAILLGAAGVGKSAILDEVVVSLWGGPVGVVRVEGRRSLHTPLEPFSEAARDMLGLQRGGDARQLQQVSRHLRTRFNLSEDDVVRLLDRLSGRASSLAVSLDLVEREEAASLRTFYARVLEIVPSVLVVEDADALDPASAALVLDLMESTSHFAVSVIATARGEPWPEWKAGNAVRLHVGELDDKSARNLVRDRLTGIEATAEVIESAVKKARGSPLKLDLLVQAMLAGALEREGAAATLPTSESDRALVDLALRRIPKDARSWLQCAALVGVRAPVVLLQAWAPPSVPLAAVLRECTATNLARSEGDYLVFRNEGVRELITELLADRDRRVLHRFIAKWFAATHPARAPYEVIAAQFEACGEYRSAAEHFENAARNFFDRAVFRAAAALFKRASHAHELAEDHEAASRAAVDQVEALLLSGDAKGASDALSHLERVGVKPPGLRPRIFALLSRTQGDPEVGVRTLLRTAESLPEKDDGLARFEVETELAELLDRLGRVPEAAEHAAKAQQIAKQIFEEHEGLSIVDSVRISRSASFLARLRASLGKLPAAREVLEESLRHAAKRGDDESASRLLAHLAVVASAQNQVEEAAELAERALGLARSIGDRAAAARIAVNLGAYQARLGRDSSATESLLLGRALSQAVGWRGGIDLTGEALRKN